MQNCSFSPLRDRPNNRSIENKYEFKTTVSGIFSFVRVQSKKEPVNGYIHLIGAILSVLGLLYLLSIALKQANPLEVVSVVVFGSSLILLYSASATYHMVKLSDKNRVLFRRIDHFMIFVLIAGSYTPFCLITLHGPWGWSFLGVVWGLTILGFFLKFYWTQAPGWLSLTLYLGMGWIGMIAAFPISKVASTFTLQWLLAGGILYTVGAIFYGLKKPKLWSGIFSFHEIWHLFVVAASACHFVAVKSIL